jgi:CRISPR-associated endonuclease Csn1
MKASLTLGLDIGISSIGFCLIKQKNDDITPQIKDSGVYLFNSAEEPKSGRSLALPRRIARGQRRRLERRKRRLKKVRNLFIKQGLISRVAELSSKVSPWELRSLAVKESTGNNEKILNGLELAQVLYSIAKYRGYHNQFSKGDIENEEVDSQEQSKTTSQSKENDTDDKELKDKQQMLKGLLSLKEEFIKKKKRYKTIGSYLYQNYGVKYEKIRNSSGEYKRTILRKLLIDEVNTLFNEQIKRIYKLNSELERFKKLELFKEDFQNEYLKVLQFQRSIRGIGEMIGDCDYETGKKRACRASYSAEKYIVLERLNNLEIKGVDSPRKLTKPEIDALLKELYSDDSRTHELSFKRIRGVLCRISSNQVMRDDEYFNFLSGTKRKKKGQDKKKSDVDKSENKVFVKLPAYRKIKDAVVKNISKESWDILKENHELLDEIGRILTINKGFTENQKVLSELQGIDKNLIDPLAELSFRGTLKLSLEAARKVNTKLLEGSQSTYRILEDLYERVGMIKEEKRKFLGPFNSTTNPVVNRVLFKTRKLINTIIKRYGQLDSIKVELAREISKSFNDRKEIEKENNSRRMAKVNCIKKLAEECKKELNSDFINARKLALWKEQERQCIYTRELIDISWLQLKNEECPVEIDHIIPRSQHGNNSLENCVLVYKSANQNKGNRLPLQYLLQEKPSEVETYIRHVNSLRQLSKVKRAYLLREKLSEEEKEKFKDRNLNDTRYIGRELTQYLRSHLSSEVLCVNGFLISELRNLGGFKKILPHSVHSNNQVLSNESKDGRKDRENHLHHAVDAAVIAIVSSSLVQRLTRYYQQREKRDKTEILHLSDLPGIKKYVSDYKIYIDERLNDTKRQFIVRQSKKKYTGAIHEETARCMRVEVDKDDNRIKIFTYRISIDDFKNIKADKKKKDKNDYEKKIGVLNNLFDKEGRNMKMYETLCNYCKKIKEVDDEIEKKKKQIEKTKKDDPRRTIYKDEKIKLEEKRKNMHFYLDGKDGTNATQNPKYPAVKHIMLQSSKESGIVIHDGKRIQDKDLEVNKKYTFYNNGGLIRIDIFAKKKKFFAIPIYTHHVGQKMLPNRVCLPKKDESEWDVIDDTYIFCFSLFPDDLISIGHGKNEFFCYYSSFDRGANTIRFRYYRNGILQDKCNRIGIRNLKFIHKYSVNILGNMKRIEKEKRSELPCPPYRK